jgi:transposase
MIEKIKRGVMEAIHRCVAGLDVHKEIVAACRRRLMGENQVEWEVKKFKTTTRGLKELAAWLEEWGVTDVAMESTGVYWIPVWNLLEEKFKLLLTNAQHLEKVPGRKTDVTDAEWIAQCLHAGMLRGSFVPPEHVRQWRDLTRQRMRLLDMHTSVVNRIHKTLEQGNIKLASVASDVMGVSGRAMLRAMSEGQSDPVALADLARGELRKKYEELIESLEGRLTDHQRWILKRLLGQAKFLEEEIAVYDERVEELMRPFEEEIELLDTIHGIGRRSAENLLAELGPDMSQFPSEDDITSWGGMCPGNNESGGKRKSSKTPKGNKWLRRVLVEAAWAGARTKGSYLAAQYQRLGARRGKKRAIVAVGRTILIAAYHILKEKVEYKDLGGNYFDQRNREQTAKYLVKRLQSLGYEIDLKLLEKTA